MTSNNWYLLFTLTVLSAGWILRNIVNFLVFYHLIKGMCPKICGNWVLLIYLWWLLQYLTLYWQTLFTIKGNSIKCEICFSFTPCYFAIIHIKYHIKMSSLAPHAFLGMLPIFTSNYRHKSVQNRCAIKLLSWPPCVLLLSVVVILLLLGFCWLQVRSIPLSLKSQ